MNILWIVTTQWRASAFGYAGDPNARTPHLDALAARSVNYTQAVTPHPFGPFARAALLTGVPSPENGLRNYYDPLPANARTVAHDFAERGYETAFFGKWHLGRRDPAAALVGEAHARTRVPPDARGGFEFWEGFESGFLLNDPWLHGSGLPEPIQIKGYQSDVIAGRAARWIAQRPDGRSSGSASRIESGRSRPWFCVVSLEAPHPPYAAPAAGVVPCDPRALTLPANVPRGSAVEAQARTELAGYYAHIEATDRALGGLLTTAANQPPDEEKRSKGRVAGSDSETLVVFTSVHGDMHGAHGLFRKGWPHEESVCVPLLVQRPGVAARRDDAAVSLVELAAMTASWVREDAPTLFAPTHALISMPSVVALPHQCDRIWRGVRTPARKLVLNADGSPWLFFDLARDPFEMENLASDPSWQAEIAALGAWAR